MNELDERGYYELERGFLQNEASAFAQRHPDVARHLDLDTTSVRDPYIAQLIDGFSFLHGRMRRFLDRQFPEMVHALFEMAYPLHLRPVPSKTIVQFDMLAPELIDNPIDIPRGTELKASGIGPQGETYTFTTCWPVHVQPVKLTKIFEDPDAHGDHHFTLQLHPLKAETAASIEWDQLEFCILDVAEPKRAFEIFQMMATPSLHKIVLRADRRQVTANLELEWTGFSDQCNYHPDEHGLVTGRHFMRDFFDFTQRFFFFRLKGLQQALRDLEYNDIRIDFQFKEPFKPGMAPQTGNINLGCCVAQNLFEMRAEPIALDKGQLEYMVTMDAEREDLEVYSIQNMMAAKGREEYDVRPYYQFQDGQANAKSAWFYTLRRDAAHRKGWEMYVQFQRHGQVADASMKDFVVSTQAFCTNRDFAERLGKGQLDRIDPSVPESIGVRNLTGATAAAWPRLFGQEALDFIAHLCLDFAELTHLPALKRLLDLYTIDRAAYGGSQPSEALVNIESGQDYLIKHGACLHGRKLRLVVDGSKISPHRGEVAMFAQAFAAFLRAFCPINGFIRFQLEDTHYKRVFEHVVWG